MIGPARSYSDNNYGPMKLGETRKLEINRKNKPNCRLLKDEIMVRKEKEDIMGEYRIKMVDYVESFADAYIIFSPGEIGMLSVLGDARECGIGKMLMQLCFNEEKIHHIKDNDKNEALIMIKSYSIEFPEGEEMEKWVTSKCEKLLYLLMSAKPPSAARVYFNSAIDSKFTEMFIALKDEFYPKEGPCSVEALKERYTDDGYMKDNAGSKARLVLNDKVMVKGQNWFFCKPKIPTSHVKCTNLDKVK